jgi:hypothetical protein
MNRLRPRWCGCTSPSEWCASRGICFETVAVRRIRGAVLDVLEAELREAVRDAVAALPDRLRWAVMGHFGDGREMKSLAEDLGVTPSRVSQLCSEAVSLLRVGVAARLDPGRAAVPRPAGGPTGPRRNAYVAAMAERSALGPDDGGPRPHGGLTAGSSGGRDRRRSGDLALFRRALCQLSYPTSAARRRHGGPDGI